MELYYLSDENVQWMWIKMQLDCYRMHEVYEQWTLLYLVLYHFALSYSN